MSRTRYAELCHVIVRMLVTKKQSFAFYKLPNRKHMVYFLSGYLRIRVKHWLYTTCCGSVIIFAIFILFTADSKGTGRAPEAWGPKLDKPGWPGNGGREQVGARLASAISIIWPV